MDVYAENILDHYRNPRKKLKIENEKWKITHAEINISCGDELTIGLVIENDRVIDIGWEGTGCAISQASMSILSEELTGKSTAELAAMTPQHVYDLLGVPIGLRRVKCALLSLHTLKNALRKAKGKDLQGWSKTAQS